MAQLWAACYENMLYVVAQTRMLFTVPLVCMMLFMSLFNLIIWCSPFIPVVSDRQCKYQQLPTPPIKPMFRFSMKHTLQPDVFWQVFFVRHWLACWNLRYFPRQQRCMSVMAERLKVSGHANGQISGKTQEVEIPVLRTQGLSFVLCAAHGSLRAMGLDKWPLQLSYSHSAHTLLHYSVRERTRGTTNQQDWGKRNG